MNGQSGYGKQRKTPKIRRSQKRARVVPDGTCVGEADSFARDNGTLKRFRCSGETDERGNSTEYPNCPSGGIIRLLIQSNIKQEANLRQQLDDTVQNREELQKLLDSLREFNE